MRYVSVAAFVTGLFALSGCGPTTETQAATGAVGGAAVGGLPGAAVGGAVGAVAGDDIQDAVN